VRGIRLGSGDKVVGMEILSPGATILTITEKGYGKRTPLDDYRLQRRGGQGVITIRTSARNGKVVRVAQVVEEDEVMLITDGGKVLRCPVSGISTMGRATQGVRVMNLDNGERLVSMARVAERDEESFEGEESPDPVASQGNGAEAGSNGAEQNETEEDAGA
jgi:DNA gyrase subunit A